MIFSSRMRGNPGLILTICAALLLTLSAAVDAITLKVATLAPEGTSWMKQMRKGASEISEKTDGRVKIKFYPGGVMGNTSTVLQKMRVGQLQGGAFTGASLSQVYPDAQLYSLPMVFHSHEEVAYVRQRMDDTLIKGLADKGMVVLGISDGGFAYIMCKKPLRRLGDLKGQKVWMPEGDVLTEAMFESAGVSPIPLPVADVYTGLQTGLLDTVAGVPTGIVAFQWYTSVTHLTDVPLMFLSGMFAVDSKAFKRIKPGDQKIVRKVMGRIFKDLDAVNRADNESARSALQSQGIEFVHPNRAERDNWESIAKQGRERMVSRAKYTPALVDRMLGYIREYRTQQQ
ncbi:MAG: TRAP transporter substrate-binding protein DctP [Pseudomonadota bacterium]